MAVGGTLIVVNRTTFKLKKMGFELKMGNCGPFARMLLRIFVDTIGQLVLDEKMEPDHMIRIAPREK